jgi:hypothetical protein
MQLRPGDISNYETLKRACLNQDLALVNAVRKSDDAVVALVCAVSRAGEDHHLSPLAVMVEGDPFELFEDPTQKKRSKPRPRLRKAPNRYLEV